MNPFVYDANPGRVVFGKGALARLPDEAERLGLSRVLVIGYPGRHDRSADAAGRLGRLAVGRFAGAEMHTPTDVTERAMTVLEGLAPDGIVSIGGGSTIGLGKALAVRTGLRQIAIPMTYAGSEMTPILGETQDGIKTTISDPGILPKVVIYDPDLTASMPASLAATSGMNAMAHAVEALYARDRNPVVSLLAMEAIKALFDALPAIVANPDDRDARERALYGAYLCGVCLGSVGMALHHKLCHTLGGTFGLPHAETHGVVLPHALAYNLINLPDLKAHLCGALGVDDPARAIFDLERRLGIPAALQEIGMSADDVDRATDIAMSKPYWNPRPLEREPIRRLLSRALRGEPPATCPDGE